MTALNSSKKLLIFLLISSTMFFVACETCETPSISDIQFCNVLPSGENQCDSNQLIFSASEPSIITSSKINCIEFTDKVTYSLYFDNAGTLVLVSQDVIDISTAGEESDSYDTFAGLTLPPNTLWNIGEWQVDIEVDSDIPTKESRRFTIVE